MGLMALVILRSEPYLLVSQGYHCKRCSTDILLSSLDNRQRGPGNQELIVSILAPVHDECTERPAVGGIWKGKLVAQHMTASQYCHVCTVDALLPGTSF